MDRKIFRKQYPELYQLLSAGFACDADFDIFDVDETLKKWFNPNAFEVDKESISQAREILAMEPFPEELIGEIANTWSPIMTMKEWLTEVVEKLEARIAEAEAAQKHPS